MRKQLFFTNLMTLSLFLAVTSIYAQNIPNKFLYIDGSGQRRDHLEFFTANFKIEAAAAGYTVTNTKNDAAFTFKFVILPNMVVDRRGNWVPAPPNDNQFLLQVSLINNINDYEILNFDFFYTDLAEMYEYTQFIFNRATIYIPPDKETIVEVEKIVEKEIEVEIPVPAEMDRLWQNKWLYLKLAFYYPISFYRLQSEGLHGDRSLWNETSSGGKELNPLEHTILPKPGATVGLEFQFVKFMALGVNFHLSLGDFSTSIFPNLEGSASLLFNIKTKYFMLQPYGSFLMSFNKSDDFELFPKFAVGGGLQVGVRGGKIGSFFIDVNFMYYLDQPIRHNPFIRGNLFPFPPVIHYKLFTVGISAGYRFGFVDRKPSRRQLAREEAKLALDSEEIAGVIDPENIENIKSAEVIEEASTEEDVTEPDTRSRRRSSRNRN